MFVIQDEVSLNALLHALLTAKFHCDPEDAGEIAGSPFIADMLNRAYDALIAMARQEGREGIAHRLEQERSADNRDRELKAVRTHLLFAQPQWKTWTAEQKQEYVRVLFSPYITSLPLMFSIISQLDALGEEHISS